MVAIIFCFVAIMLPLGCHYEACLGIK